VLTDLVELYEAKHVPVGFPSPLGAIRFRMEQGGLSQRDLIPFMGSRAKVSEVLSGKRLVLADCGQRALTGACARGTRLNAPGCESVIRHQSSAQIRRGSGIRSTRELSVRRPPTSINLPTRWMTGQVIQLKQRGRGKSGANLPAPAIPPGFLAKRALGSQMKIADGVPAARKIGTPEQSPGMTDGKRWTSRTPVAAGI